MLKAALFPPGLFFANCSRFLGSWPADCAQLALGSARQMMTLALKRNCQRLMIDPRVQSSSWRRSTIDTASFILAGESRSPGRVRKWCPRSDDERLMRPLPINHISLIRSSIAHGVMLAMDFETSP
ncbi:hypothetical protein V2G26_004917 [Clonostachys chloroleuca]